MEDNDVTLLFSAALFARRRRQRFPSLHEHIPHHIFGPQVNGIDDVTVVVLVRVSLEGENKNTFVKNTVVIRNERLFTNSPAIDDGKVLDVISVFAINEIDQSLWGDALEILMLASSKGQCEGAGEISDEIRLFRCYY